MTRVLFLTPKKQYAEKAADVLSNSGEFSITCLHTFEDLLTVLSTQTEPDKNTVLLVDLDTPNIAGSNIFETIHLCFPGIPVISAVENQPLSSVVDASQKGAFGFVLLGNDHWSKLPGALVSLIHRFGLKHKGLNPHVLSEHHAKLVRELSDSYSRSRALAQQLVQIREEESSRIARELHDQLGQALTALKLDVAWIRRRMGRLPHNTPLCSEVLARLDLMEKAIDTTILTTRKICSELRPGILDDLGLVAAIDWQANEFKQRTTTNLVVSLPKSEPPITPASATAVFRIFQEILTNIARHSKARNVTVELRQTNDALILQVKDDGCGFDDSALTPAQALGILGMKERAQSCGGSLSIQSAPGHGTLVTVSVPLANTATPNTNS
ncbi:MAG: histidine kinase [Verrucomicrobiae bacterium]|nr:histidine kinase [Verrucomicrobiae bacterium]